MRAFDPDIDEMPDTECLEHPFMDFVAAENHVSAGDRAWDKWINRAEALLGFELDANEETDGYSIDGAYAAFKAETTPQEYADEVRANLKRLGKPIPLF